MWLLTDFYKIFRAVCIDYAARKQIIFLFFPPSLDCFYSFSPFIALDRISSTRLSTCCVSRHLCPILDLKVKTFRFLPTSDVRDGQGGLACCHSWGRKESDTTEQLNWTDDVRCEFLTCGLFCIEVVSFFFFSQFIYLWLPWVLVVVRGLSSGHMGSWSFPTRDWACVPCIGRWILSHWTTREIPVVSFCS